ncbi:MAG: hypothetical protein C4583_15270 [Anaerolineaceae bacterium]|nr:MAG: hypothetical protein C4583_15270 [Anaerolineaceae bacterium]
MNRSLWITLLLVSALAATLALVQAVPQLQGQDISLMRSKWTLLLGLFALNVPAAGFAVWGLTRGWFDSLLARLDSTSLSGLWRGAAALGVILLPSAFLFVRLGWFADILPQLFPSLWLFVWISILAALLVKLTTRLSFTASFASVILTQAVLFRVWGILNAVTDFPFTREYSETSRFYYGSLWFSDSLYGMDLPLSTLHPSRYLLQAIPFIVPSLPLWTHRLWQSLLWILLTGTASYLLARRLNLSSKGLTALLAMWGFVYFLQGAVYYHLQVCVILILWGASSKHPLRSFIIVLLASLWVGMSRVNWFPVPAMLAIAIYLLEEPFKKDSNLFKYFAHPALWTITGLLSALLSQTLYVFWSGNADNASDFGTAFTSDLIWSRLLPNATYPMGVLAGILLVSAPSILALIFILRGKRADWHIIRPLGIFSMLLVLFLGGLVVSTKIGGGGDLHNMDAYLVLLALVVTSWFAGRVASETQIHHWGRVPDWILALAVLIPAALSIGGVSPRFTYDRGLAQKDLDQLRALVEPIVKEGGEILFISERHLVTFNMLEGVQLVPDYEVVTLMEMAMSGNDAYLQRFTSDLASHRFALIVSRKQRIVKKEGEPFAEENNVWIDAISTPLLCYYQRNLTLESSNTLLLVPSESADCP